VQKRLEKEALVSHHMHREETVFEGRGGKEGDSNEQRAVSSEQ
jgi:hypothetical protein